MWQIWQGSHGTQCCVPRSQYCVAQELAWTTRIGDTQTKYFNDFSGKISSFFIKQTRIYKDFSITKATGSTDQRFRTTFLHYISCSKFLRALGLHISSIFGLWQYFAKLQISSEMNNSRDCYPSIIAKRRLFFKLFDINIEDISRSL